MEKITQKNLPKAPKGCGSTKPQALNTSEIHLYRKEREHPVWVHPAKV